MFIQPRKRLLLRGKIVQSDGTAPGRYLYVIDGKIASISRRRPPGTDDISLIETGSEDWIFPGLIDLHTHASYNLLPLWDPPAFPYANRFKWRSDPLYRRDIRNMLSYLNKPHEVPEEDDKKKIRAHQIELATFSELQAIAGGTTTLQEGHSLEEKAGLEDIHVLCRSTANPRELGHDADDSVFSVVDFFRPNDQNQPEETWALPQYLKDRQAGKLIATLAHLAEGRSGFGNEQGPDSYSRLEFEAFMNHPSMADISKVRANPMGLIHCCGIDPYNKQHTRFLRERDISVIWSPVSNLLLYGETIDTQALVDDGINVALGSDWSPSGSKHVWDEARFARFFFETLGSPVSDVQIFQMVTVNAARCLATRNLGRLAVGAMADFFILRSPLESDNPMEVFFKTTDRDVLATVVGGEAIYGDRTFLKSFGRPLQAMPKLEGSAVANKAVYLPEALKNGHGDPLNLDRDITHLEQMMKNPPEPLPATKRSNLLASSDTPYRARIAELRAETIKYGWRINRLCHRQAAKNQ